MIDHDGQVSLAFADRDLIEPEALQACVQVASSLGVGGDALADPTEVRHAIRIRWQIAVFDVFTVSHA